MTTRGWRGLWWLPAILAVLVLAGCSRGRNWNVLLITMDTTRADHLRCYGNEMIETPAINELARDGVLFERAFSPVPLTMPAHTSIMTGTLPPYNSVRDNGTDRLPDSMETLAELLKGRGWQTAGFISAAVLKKAFNIDQGFDHWDQEDITEQKENESALVADRKAGVTTGAVLKWLDQIPRQKFFFWVHYYDPHEDYDPPSPYKEYYILSPYDGEIAYMDSQIKRLIARLKEKGLYDNTLVVAVADHGEGLGDHEEGTHSIFIYNSTTHVPLIIRVPGLKKTGQRLPQQVYLIDIMPTILDYLGIKPPKEVEGRSLRPLIEGQEIAFKDGYSESEYTYFHYGWSGLKALYGPRYKYIKAPKAELYDLNEDFGEQNNLLEKLPKVAKEMEVKLDGMVQDIENDSSRPKAEMADLTERQLDELRALGYVGGEDRSALPKERDRDPKDYRKVIPLDMKLNALLVKKNYPEVLKLCDEILGLDPKNIEALEQRANALFALGLNEEAIQAYTENIKLTGSRSITFDKLGNLYLRLYNQAKAGGNQEEAQKNLQAAINNFSEAIKVNAKDMNANYYIGRILLEKGEYDKARAHYEGMREDSPMAHLGLAHYWELIGDNEMARTEYETAIKNLKEPSLPQIFIDYASFLFAKQNDTDRALELLEKTYEYDQSQRVDQQFMQLLNTVRNAKGLGNKEDGEQKDRPGPAPEKAPD